MNNNQLVGAMASAVLATAIIVIVGQTNNQEVKVEEVITAITPLHKLQPVRTCYSPFDVYKTYEYEITDDNQTLITSHGRVYHLDECRLDN